MRISPTNYYSNTPKKPAFRSMSSSYKLTNDINMGLYTYMFRRDLDWFKFTDFIINNFKDKDKVNMVQFAPSDGSEGYTIIMSLLNTNPSEAEKFFPIQAYDINEKIISAANSGFINLEPSDFLLMNSLGIPIFKYFSNLYDFSSFNIKKENRSLCLVNDNLQKRIQFNTGDMFKILPSIKDNSNTIIFARNSLAYYKKEIDSFIKKASEVLKTGSLFVVGILEEDHCESCCNFLKKYNFERVMNNVYRKI